VPVDALDLARDERALGHNPVAVDRCASTTNATEMDEGPHRRAWGRPTAAPT
jgi:hypothetical protein